jgi:hypothetical protein
MQFGADGTPARKRRLERLARRVKRLLKGKRSPGKPSDPRAADFASYMVSPKHVEALQRELAAVAWSFLAQTSLVPGHVGQTDVGRLVSEFFSLYSSRPVTDNTGGSKFHNCFWLFLTTSILQPRLIVESGVWKGQTSWLFRAACPRASIHCFDISFKRLVYRDPSIHYVENDWKDAVFATVPRESLCFFDDHIDHAQRIREAHAKGFRLLLFDDNPPAHKVYSFGYPGVPTVDMIMDETLVDGEALEWFWQGESRRHVHREQDVVAARALIERYAIFPDVSTLTRYGNHAFLGFVELRD